MSPYSTDITDPQTVNKYAYVRNNPMRYTDPDGHVIDYILDAIGIGYDVWDLATDPSWGKVGVLTADVGLAAAPFVPTVGAVKVAAKLANLVGDGSRTTGLGQFVRVSESMSARAATYQSKITGTLPDVGYLVDGVKFDGKVGGALVDAKGAGYANFVKGGKFVEWFRGADDLAAQAQRQVAAAQGSPIKWHFAERSAADATRKLLQERKISGLEILHTPE